MWQFFRIDINYDANAGTLPYFGYGKLMIPSAIGLQDRKFALAITI